MRRLLLSLAMSAAVLLLSAAAGSVSVSVESVAVAVAGGMLWAFWRTSVEHQKKVESSFARVETALYGDEHPDGSRPTGGLVRAVEALQQSIARLEALEVRLEEIAVQSATAASAARHAQELAARALHRDPDSRTRLSDRRAAP